MNAFFYDIECDSKLFCVTFIDVNTPKKYIEEYIRCDIANNIEDKKKALLDINAITFIVDERRNDILKLISFLSYYKILIGYNNNAYDNILLDYAIIFCKDLTNVEVLKVMKITSDKLILSGSDGLKDIRSTEYYKKYKRPYGSVDLYKMLYLDKTFTSLKHIAVILKWYLIQDLPIQIDNYYSADKPPFTEEETETIVYYNINDVLITWKLYFEVLEEVVIRFEATEAYHTNLLSASRSKIGYIVFGNYYQSYSGMTYRDLKDLRTFRNKINFREIINDNIHFNNRIFTDFLNKAKDWTSIIGFRKFNETIKYKNVIFTFKEGGLHTDDRAGVISADEDFAIIDADVTSFYPRIIINNRIHPKHLDEDIFIESYENIVNDRVEAKTEGKKLKAEILKIVVNAIYGKLGFMYSWLFDIQAMFQVTINGQLLILSLAERYLDAGFQVISANTDGVTCKVDRKRLDEYNKVSADWQTEYNMSLEFTNYKKIARCNVNNYMAIKGDYKDTGYIDINDEHIVKQKGVFVTKLAYSKGYRNPVVSIALNQYFANNIPIHETVRNHKDIYDFCTAQKVGKQFRNEYHAIVNGALAIIPVQKSVRYYVSNAGGVVYKIKKVKKKSYGKEFEVDSKNALIAKENTKIFNIFRDVNSFKDYDIRYGYYIKETAKFINYIENTITKKMKENSQGGLFDDDAFEEISDVLTDNEINTYYDDYVIPDDNFKTQEYENE